MHVDGVLFQRVEGYHSQRLLVRRRQHDGCSDAGLECLAPGGGAHAPAIARLETGKAEVRRGGDQVIALFACELEELPRDLRADDVQAEILRPSVAATVPIEARSGRGGAGREGAAEHVSIVVGHRASYLSRRTSIPSPINARTANGNPTI